MKAVIGVSTDVGRVRQGNEDAYLVQAPLFAVADGMGGHLAGDVASATAVETITRTARDGAPMDPNGIVTMVKAANGAIYEKAASDPSLRGMGTTCTLLLIDEDEVHIAHVGDSRAYLLRERELSQLTEDHTLVGRMVQEGRLTKEEAGRHPQRSIITRALGVDPEVDVDTSTLPVREGDRFLICSDGLTSMIDESAIRSLLLEHDDPQAAADALVAAANEAGGEDNITVLLLDVRPGRAGEDDDAPERAAAPPPPERVDTSPEPPPAPPPTGARSVEPRRRWPRVVLGLLLVVALVAGAAYAAARYTMSNAFYVGADGDGNVTIYRGIPEEVLGVTLREAEETTGLQVGELPDFLQDDVRAGIKVETLDEAQQRVTDLQARARDAEFERTRDRDKGSQ